MDTYVHTYSKTVLSNPLNTQKISRPTISILFHDNRPDAAIQRNIIQHISHCPRVSQQKTLQELADLNTSKIEIGTDTVCQRKPEDFRNLAYLDLPSRAIIHKRWISIQNAVTAYSNLDEEQIDIRKQTLKKIAHLIQEWRKNNSEDSSSSVQANEKRQALSRLEDVIHIEWQSFILPSDQPQTFYTGNLQALPTVLVSPDPLLTRKVSGDTKWAFFPSASPLYYRNENKFKTLLTDSNNIFYVPANSMCEIVDDPLSEMLYDSFKLSPSPELTSMTSNVLNCRSKDLWVSKYDVTIINKTTSQPSLSYSDALLEDVLFEHDPCMEDIKQSNLGDCYLLASIISLVKTSPHAIRDMMKDHLNGTVTIRFYDIEPTTPPTYTPRYITVKKSRPIHTDTQKPAFAAGALWVSLLEKAYAAAGFMGTNPDTLPVTTGSYGIIESGYNENAISHLIGKNATATHIYTKSVTSNVNFYKNLYPTMLSSSPTATTLSIFRTLLSSPSLSNLKNKFDTLLTSKEQARIEEIETLISRYDQEIQIAARTSMPPQRLTAQNVINALKTLYPGKRGSGLYTPYQLNLFMQIRDAIDNRQMVLTATKEKVVKQEKIGKGLVGTHSYAIVGYEPQSLAHRLIKDLASPNEDAMPVLRQTTGEGASTEPFPPTLLSLQLANPWGETSNSNSGRSYPNVHLTQENHPNRRIRMRARGRSNNSLFLLELSDFTKRFGTFTISESLHPAVVPAAAPNIVAPIPPAPPTPPVPPLPAP